MACTYEFTNPSGNKITITGMAKMKAYLANGGMEELGYLPEAGFPWEGKQKTLLEQHAEIKKRIENGNITADEMRDNFENLVKSGNAVMTELSKFTKKELESRIRSYIRPDAKKQDLVEDAYESMITDYWFGDGAFSYSVNFGGKESPAEAKAKKVRQFLTALTDNDIQANAERIKKSRQEYAAKKKEQAEGMDNPKTLDDYIRLMRSKMEADKLNFQEARMTLTTDQREAYDSLAAEKTRGERKDRADQQKTDVRAAAQSMTGDIVETKHTKTGEDLFVVKTAERVERDVYNEWNATAKRLGGWYSSFRGAGAVPGFQFKTRENAEAFLQYLGGDVTQAKQAIQERRDAYADDKSQTAIERLTEMADRLEEKANESLGRERKTNTHKRAGEAARAEASAEADKAMAKTMRNIANAISSGKVKFLDMVRQKVQVELFQRLVDNAHYDESTKKTTDYKEQEKIRQQQPTKETADYVEYPNYTAYRSDLATLGRALLETDGTKKLGQQILKVADDVSDAYLKFAKNNLFDVGAFVNSKGERAAFKSKTEAEESIIRSGFKGQAIVLPFKRGENMIILSPSEAMKRGIWKGDNDKRISLSKEFGKELVEKIGKAERRGAKISVPWQFETAYIRQNRLSAMGIETPAELRAAIREFIGLREAAKEADKIKQMERAMIGRANDGLDFFPTPASVADEMVETADIKDGMSVLEPSAGMGHIAERIRKSGIEPDVVELSGDRRELLEAKGFNVVGNNFLELSKPKPSEWEIYKHPLRGYGTTPEAVLNVQYVVAKTLAAAGNKRNDGYEYRYVSDGPFDVYKVERRIVTDSGYDRIIMNPPFSDRRDMEHVQHAYDLLKPGGRLVAIMGEGVFFGKDKKAQAFRDWLEEHNVTEEKLDTGTFNDPTLPVTTNANARMVVIDKPVDDVKFSKTTQPQNAHTKQTLTDAIQSVMDKHFYKGFFAALSDTLKFKFISTDEADKVISGRELFSKKENPEFIRIINEANAILEKYNKNTSFIGMTKYPSMLRFTNSSYSIDVDSGLIWGGSEQYELRRQFKEEDIKALLALKKEISTIIKSETKKKELDAFKKQSKSLGYLYDVWNTIADNENAFYYGYSDSSDIETIADEMTHGAVRVESESHNTIVLSGKNGSITIRKTDTDTPYIQALSAGSNKEKQGGGTALYQVALTWAHNNGKTMRGDPEGLSSVNVLRRTENMISSALRHGTTRHLKPHSVQKEEGLQWKGTDEQKIALMLQFSKDQVFDAVPELTAINFNPNTGKFELNGRELSDDDIEEKLEATDQARKAGVGLSTAKRAIITSSALQELQDGKLEKLLPDMFGRLAPSPLLYSKDGLPVAFYNPKDDTTYFIYDNISKDATPQYLQGLVLHEVAVHALQLGKDNASFKRILDDLQKSTDPRVIAAKQRAIAAGTKPEHIAEETLAYLIENYKTQRLGIAQRFIQWLKQAMRKLGIGNINGFDWVNKLSVEELHDMAVSALRNAPSDLLFDSQQRNEGIKQSNAEQPRLAPNGKPSNLNADIRYSVSDSAINDIYDDSGYESPSQTKAILNRINKLADKAQRQSYGALTVRQLAKIGRHLTPQLQSFADILQKREALQKHYQNQSGELIDDYWRKLDDKAIYRLNKLINDSSLSDINAAKAWQGVEQTTVIGANGQPITAYLAWTQSIYGLQGREKIKEIAERLGGEVTGKTKAVLDTRENANKFLQELAKVRKAKTDALRKKEHDTQRIRYNHLPNEAKHVYNDAYKQLDNLYDKKLDGIKKRIYSAIINKSKAAEFYNAMRLQFESNKMNWYYAPLARFGDYWLYGMKSGKRFFQTFESPQELEFAKKNFQGQYIGSGLKIDGLEKLGTELVGEGFISNLQKMLADADAPSGLQDDIYQMFLSTLPSVSMRKNAIHREGIAGFEQDAMRAFANSMYHGSKQLSNLTYNSEMSGLLADASEAVDVAASSNRREGVETENKAIDDLIKNWADSTVADLSAIENKSKKETAMLSLRKRLDSFSDDDAIAALKKMKEKNDAVLSSARQIAATEGGAIQASKIISELNRAYTDMQTPKHNAIVTALMQMNFITMLGLSPAFFFVNTLQTPGVAMPRSFGRFGDIGKVNAEYAKSYKQFMQSVMSLNKDIHGNYSMLATLQAEYDKATAPEEKLRLNREIETLKTFMDEGDVDNTMGYDSIDIAENGGQGHSVLSKVAKGMAFMAHHSERMNREITLMSNYRMAIAKGMTQQQAINTARELNIDSHQDYSGENTARFMRDPTAKLLTQFMKYKQGMYFLWLHSFNDALIAKNIPLAERKEAQRTLIGLATMQTAFAGVLGFPLMGALMSALDMLGGFLDDDDDPWDTKKEIRMGLHSVLDSFGDVGYKMAETITNGAVNAFSPIELHNRMDLSDVIFREPLKELEGREAGMAQIAQIAGPTGGNVIDLYETIRLINNGDWWRATETFPLVPKFVVDALKSARYANEGATTQKGLPVKDMDATEVMLQAIGFSSSELSRQYDKNKYQKNRESAISDARQKLVEQAATAKMDGEADAFREAWDGIREFNAKYPSIKITNTTIMQSIRKRKKNIQENEGGVLLSKKKGFIRNEESF